MSGLLDPPTPEQVGTSEMAAGSEVLVLIVDDNAAKRLALKAVLLPLGYCIVEADSGIAALRCLMADDFAVILLDVCMPVMDGFETAALIRQRRQSEMTPIIFITAYSRDEVLSENRYAQGAVDFIFAPVAPAEIRAKVSVFANTYIKAKVLAARSQDLQIYADQLRVLTDVAPTGIFQTDADNKYVYTNPYWSEITGVSAEDAAGQSWDSIIDGNERDALLSEFGSLALFRGELCHRFEIHPHGGEPRTVVVNSKPIPDSAGQATGWVGTLVDVTAEAEAEKAMSQARDSAIAAITMQKDFAASASHELRTPTTSILGFVEEVLASESLTPEDRGFLEIAHRNALRLSRLIDDLLILSHADSGTTMLHLEHVALSLLVERVVGNFAATAQSAGVNLHIDSGDLDRPLMADPLRLEQALTNLVDNALKFAPAGSEVRVAVQWAKDTVAITVADNGPGIDQADFDKIFQHFYRAQQAGSAGVKGSGLGLAIAARMIEAQHGRIEVESTVDQGSTFTLTLPTNTVELQRT